MHWGAILVIAWQVGLASAVDILANYELTGAPLEFSGASLGVASLPALQADAIVVVTNTSTLVVDACPAGYFSYADAQACTSCGAGKYSGTVTATTEQTCISCEAGKYSASLAASSVDTCANCPANFYFSGSGGASIAVCLECPSNSSSYAGSKLVQACICNGGYSGPNGGPCAACNSSVWCLNGQANPCPANSMSKPLSASLASCLCLPGFYGDTTIGGPELTLCQVRAHTGKKGGRFLMRTQCKHDHSGLKRIVQSLEDVSHVAILHPRDEHARSDLLAWH